MNKLLLFTCSAAFSLAAVPSCLAAGTPWDGTWKQNLAKSHLAGDTMTITQKPGGLFHLAAGGIIEYDFACDGKPYTTLGNRSIACSGSPQAGYDFTTATGSTVLAKSHRTFSADGKTMTIKGTSMRPDGSTSAYEETYRRQTGSSGLVGKWLDIKDVQQVPEIETWSVNNSALHVQNTVLKQTVDAKLDGSEGKVAGPAIPPGASVSFKPQGSNKLAYEYKLNGKVLYQGVYTLSADGKVMTDDDWIPGRESEKAIVIWEKQ
jgi:hypothetical protein